MRAPITDGAATAFAETFYTAIAAGEALDKAMTHARQAIMGLRMTGEWLVPALFLRAGDARLWAEPAAREEAQKPGKGGGTVGGTHIESLQAGTVIMGDATIDQRGSTFNIGGGQYPASTDAGEVEAKLNVLLAGQTSLHDRLEVLSESLLARFAQSERHLVAAITTQLGQERLAEVDAVLAGLDTLHSHDARLAAALDTVEDLLTALSQAAETSPDALPAEIAQIEEILGEPTLDLRHKLKLAVPIIPWLLTYEGEVDLGESVNLEAAWQALLSHFRKERRRYG